MWVRAQCGWGGVGLDVWGVGRAQCVGCGWGVGGSSMPQLRYSSSSYASFNGYMSAVQVYGRVLSSSDVAALYSRQPCSAQPPQPPPSPLPPPLPPPSPPVPQPPQGAAAVCAGGAAHLWDPLTITAGGWPNTGAAAQGAQPAVLLGGAAAAGSQGLWLPPPASMTPPTTRNALAYSQQPSACADGVQLSGGDLTIFMWVQRDANVWSDGMGVFNSKTEYRGLFSLQPWTCNGSRKCVFFVEVFVHNSRREPYRIIACSE